MAASDKGRFEGFAGQGGSKIFLPQAFFSSLLPLIDNLAELKLTLYCFWLLHQREGDIRYIRWRDLAEDNALLEALGGLQIAQSALEGAVQRGTLLAASVGQGEPLYFLNSPRGREAIKAWEEGRWQPSQADQPVALAPSAPNIFALYEQNIGMITPIIAERLKELEKEYPAQWLREAIEQAVENNSRSLAYMAGVLRRWQEKGRSQQPRKANEKAPTGGSNAVNKRFLDDDYVSGYLGQFGGEDEHGQE
jgi:DNA replication protein